MFSVCNIYLLLLSLIHNIHNTLVCQYVINNYTEKIACKFKKACNSIVYRITNKTEHILSKDTHTHKQLNIFDLPGIYKLNWTQYNKLYMGQRGCNFK